MEVDRQRLQPGEPRVALVEVSPPRLREADAGVVEDSHRAAQELSWRNEVGIEDGDERRVGQGHPVRERSRLETIARRAPDLSHRNSLATPVQDPARDDRRGLVIGIVEHLDLELLARPVQRTNGVQDTLGDVAFVVYRHLNAHPWLASWLDRRMTVRTETGRAPREV